MQETTVICDCCGEIMEEPTEIELSGKLNDHSTPAIQSLDAVVEINLEDICINCSCALESAISDVLKRRSSD